MPGRWDKVCSPKNLGGLGVKNINSQKICLLLKFCYKFLHANLLPWKEWLIHHSPFHPLHQSNKTYLGKIITSYLPLLSQITQCVVHNGSSVFFWQDRWLLSEPLQIAFPAFHSHHTQPNAFVFDILHNGIQEGLRNRLTAATTAELASLSTLLQGVTLSQEPDSRLLLGGATFSSRGAYQLLQTQPHDHHDAARIWAAPVPNKVKIFAWLLHLNMLNTRANLLRKTIIHDATCPRCGLVPEDRDHLFFLCPRAAEVWTRIGITPMHTPFSLVWTTPLPPHLPPLAWPSMLMIILWKIWDARNAKVFRHKDQPYNVTIRNILFDHTLWMHHFRKTEIKVAAASWRDHLSLCNM